MTACSRDAQNDSMRAASLTATATRYARGLSDLAEACHLTSRARKRMVFGVPQKNKAPQSVRLGSVYRGCCASADLASIMMWIPCRGHTWFSEPG